MLRNHLKIALRTLWRNRLFTSINVLGLSVGLAFVLLIFIIHHTVLNIDGFHQKRDRIYVVQEASAGTKPAPLTVAPLLPVLLQRVPGVETGTRLVPGNSLWFAANGNEFNESVTYADPGLFDVFTFPLRYGDARTALREPNAIVLSEEVSRKLFGNQNPLGNPIQVDGGRAYVVRGVLAKVPGNATFLPSVLLPISALTAGAPNRLTSWYNTDTPTYLLLRTGITPAAITAQLSALVNQYYAPEARDRTVSLLPYTDLFAEQRGPVYNVLLWGIAFIGLFMLLIVSINFLNLTSAASLARAPEVAMRTALGSAKRQVIGQFVLETLLLSCAGLFGLSAFATQQRTREIGIRKVLGAGAGGLVWLLSKRMLTLVGISFLLATPMVYAMMTQWLRTFPAQINFPWPTVMLAGLLAGLIAFLTTSYLSVQAALANPVESLRTE